jgi:hypothetical protein
MRPQRVGHAGNQRVVHCAGQFGLVLGQRVKRAVGQLELAAGVPWFVAVLGQHRASQVEG